MRFPLRLVLAAAVLTTVFTAPASAAPSLGLGSFRSGLLSGVRVTPSPVPVDALGAPAGGSLAYRLSAPASLAVTFVDGRGKIVGTAAWQPPSPGLDILPAGTGAVPFASPASDSSQPSLTFQGALRPGQRYLVVVYPSFCGDCAVREGNQPSYFGLPALKWIRTVAAPPAPSPN